MRFLAAFCRSSKKVAVGAEAGLIARVEAYAAHRTPGRDQGGTAQAVTESEIAEIRIVVLQHGHISLA